MSERCKDYGGTRKDGEPCRAWAGQWTDFSEGKCGKHRGTSADGSSHTDNQHATKHGIYADENKFYKNALSDPLQTFVDEVFQDYCTEYRRLHGDQIPAGIQGRLFEISVNHAKVIHADNWSVERPDELDSGHPLVDRETHYTDDGTQYHRYKETVVAGLQQKLRREDRQQLKDMGLLHDPESQRADATRDLAVWIAERA